MIPTHVALALALLPAGLVPQKDPFSQRAPAHFECTSDSGPFGVVTLDFDERDYSALCERHACGSMFELDGLPLPGGLRADVELRPVSALAPGARAQVVNADGSLTLLESRVRCFAGRVVGGGAAFLGVSRGQMQGYFTLAGELYYLSSGATPGRATLAHSSQTGDLDPDFCAATGMVSSDAGDTERITAAPSLRTADVFIEADDKYRARFPSDQECFDYSVLLITAASEIYRRDIGVQLNIPDQYLRIWKTTPPWGVITGFSSLKNVYTWWLSLTNPLRSLPRAAVHVLTHPIFGGTSRGVDQLCDNNGSYEISGVSGRFPYPVQHTERGNWDLFVVSHEFGHTFGSPHSSQYSPPIVCQDGSGPDSGTLMSYCHLDYGIAQVGMRFHLREQQRIRGAIADAKCLRTLLLRRGDYDGDGDLDRSDLAEAEAVLTQGFRSLAAEETLDMDADGDLDDLDHDLLAELVYGAPPASVRARNGSGVNPNALQALGNPVLGTTWRTQVLASAGSTSLLVGYDLPLAGVLTSRGELLVATTTHGGTKLFSNSSVSTGVVALHELPLPLDPALFGRSVSFQGLVVGAPGGDYYTNALDVVLSPWE